MLRQFHHWYFYRLKYCEFNTNIYLSLCYYLQMSTISLHCFVYVCFTMTKYVSG